MMIMATILFWVSRSLLILTSVNIAIAQRNGDLRLARGSISSTSYSSGRLEIYINGQWGTVCDDSFGITDASVACRQLGYAGASSSPTTAGSRSSFRSGSGTIWLDDIGCTGGESCLLSCSNRGIGSHNCYHSQDVAIYCYGTHFSTYTDCSFIGTNTDCSFNRTTGAIIGGVFGSVLLVLCLISAFCITPYCICYVKKRKGSIVPTSPAVTLVAPHPTATTSSSTKPGASYPTTGVSPYPSQPPPQPETYPTKPTAYPAKGQEPPPPYPGQAFEMQLVFKPVAGSYPLQPQEATHHNLRLYPPAEYPEQAAPYSTQAPKPNS